MNMGKILSFGLIGDSESSEKKEKSKDEPANVIDRVIKENKEIFDELAKY